VLVQIFFLLGENVKKNCHLYRIFLKPLNRSFACSSLLSTVQTFIAGMVSLSYSDPLLSTPADMITCVSLQLPLAYECHWMKAQESCGHDALSCSNTAALSAWNMVRLSCAVSATKSSAIHGEITPLKSSLYLGMIIGVIGVRGRLHSNSPPGGGYRTCKPGGIPSKSPKKSILFSAYLTFG
jgi:hypothetical protein